MLNRCALVVAACAALVVCGVYADDKTKDEAKVNGTWKFTSYTRGGTTFDKDKVDTTVTFDNGKYTAEGRNFPGKSGTYKVDTSKKPMEITFTPADGPAKGKNLEGILEMDGDKIKICASGAGGKRPAKFDGSDKMTFLLEATKEKK